MIRIESPLSKEGEQIVTRAIGCGIEVHRVLGPGFREPIYARAYCLELEAQGLPFECEKAIEVQYKRWRIPGQRLDLVVAGIVIIEIKAVTRLKRLHERQLVSYLRTTGLQVGLLMNFNTAILKEGIKRVARSAPRIHS